LRNGFHLVRRVLVVDDGARGDARLEIEQAGPTFLTSFLSVLLVMNVFLCAFNLLPLPPLDGAAVLNRFFPRGTRIDCVS
jgi:membrane-associated protease RseP (regulator of RpoE activity)